MILGIDHIVIALHKLDSAMETYRRLGFSVVQGGVHPYGSHNALIGFKDGSYIELLGFYEESPAHPWWDLLHKRGGGLIDFCLATDDIRADLAAFRAAGVAAGDLTEGGRKRPDGYAVKWINNKVGGEFQGVMPFIIEDVTPRAQRLPRETTHPNGATGIHCLSLTTADLEKHSGILGAVLGQEGAESSMLTILGLQESATTWVLTSWNICLRVILPVHCARIWPRAPRRPTV